MATGVPHPLVQRAAEPIKGRVTEPFWRGLKDGKIEARNRERTEKSAVYPEEREVRRVVANEKKRALVFAGLVCPSFAFRERIG
jgi:hypothetical protein